MGSNLSDQDDSPRSTQQRALRLWPGVVIVSLQWLARFVLPLFAPEAGAIGAIGALLGGVAIIVWWAFFSRASRLERWGGAALMVAVLIGTKYFLHESLATGGMGMIFFIYAVPLLCLAFVMWAAASRTLLQGARRWSMVATIVIACGVWTLFRTGGFTGQGNSDFSWRWAATAEDRLLADADNERDSELPSVMLPAGSEAEWPGYRGADRDGVARGTTIATDWSASPPVEVWRRPVGPGWSSFAVHGDVFYTQEQRGEEEVVSCYSATTGEPVWKHRDTARFWESNGGAGPRGTPTLSDGRVYAFGGTGILNVLDARDGALVWSRDVAADTEVEVPMWGFSSSPLVVDDRVLVAASGRLIGYDRASGSPLWLGENGGTGYSSPHLVTIDGVRQVVQLNGAGVFGVLPEDGSVLWEHLWDGYPIVQPVVLSDGDILVSVTDQSGTRRLSVTRSGGTWSVEERWTSRGLKPYFNGFVAHQGHAYGFDGSILSSIDIADGERQWKGGRYGNGQFVLLSDQDLLLVLSEKGELALVKASPDGFTELSRTPAIDGKTWNHPVLVGDRLLVRNAMEMVAFRLPTIAG